MRHRLNFLFTLLFANAFLSQIVLAQKRIICDETCEIGAETKSAAVTGAAGYAVVSPVGSGTVDPIEQAPRLNTLNDKTIAVVGVSFMSRVTHPEIKRLTRVIEQDLFRVQGEGSWIFCHSHHGHTIVQ